MSTSYRSVFTFAALSLLGLSSCKTVDTPASAGKVTVSGTLFYPDGEGVTYVVPDGAEIVGSAGERCARVTRQPRTSGAGHDVCPQVEALAAGQFNISRRG